MNIFISSWPYIYILAHGAAHRRSVPSTQSSQPSLLLMDWHDEGNEREVYTNRARIQYHVDIEHLKCISGTSDWRRFERHFGAHLSNAPLVCHKPVCTSRTCTQPQPPPVIGYLRPYLTGLERQPAAYILGMGCCPQCDATGPVSKPCNEFLDDTGVESEYIFSPWKVSTSSPCVPQVEDSDSDSASYADARPLLRRLSYH